METANVDHENKTNTTSATEESLNSSGKSDGEEVTTPEKSQTENQISHSNEANYNSKEVTDNGDGQIEQNEILNSKHIQIFLENSVKTIHDVKITISEFEKSVLKIMKLIDVNCINNIQQIDLKNFLKNFGNLRKFQEQSSHNEVDDFLDAFSRFYEFLFFIKLTQRIKAGKSARYESSRKNEDSTNTRKSKKVDKKQTSYRSESPTESEEEQSNESIYDPSNENKKYAADSSRVRNPPRRSIKAGRKSRGRPRKQNNDESSNSPVETREKKVRVSPRKYVPEDESSASNTEVAPIKSRGRPKKIVDKNDVSSDSEPPAKKSRGRPKKSIGRPKKSTIEDQSSNSVKDAKDNDQSKNHQESGSEDESKESTNSNEEEAKVLSPKTKETEEKRHKGRPRKTIINNDSEIHEKLPRGRPRSSVVETKKELNNSIVRSRGRPKKIKNIAEDETPAEST